MALPLPFGILEQSLANMTASEASPLVTTEAGTLPFGEVSTWYLQVSFTHLFPGGAPTVLPRVAFLLVSVMRVSLRWLALR